MLPTTLLPERPCRSAAPRRTSCPNVGGPVANVGQTVPTPIYSVKYLSPPSSMGFLDTFDRPELWDVWKETPVDTLAAPSDEMHASGGSAGTAEVPRPGRPNTSI